MADSQDELAALRTQVAALTARVFRLEQKTFRCWTVDRLSERVSLQRIHERHEETVESCYSAILVALENG